MVKSCAAIGCKKDTVVEKAFIDFLVVNLDKNSGLSIHETFKPTCPEVCICMFRPLH